MIEGIMSQGGPARPLQCESIELGFVIFMDYRAMSTSRIDVDRLVSDLQAGIDREENSHKLYEYFRKLILTYFQKQGFSTEECRDLTQETFLHIFHRIGTFRWESSFKSWLIKVAVNTGHLRDRALSAGKRNGEEILLGDCPYGREPWRSKDRGPQEDVLFKERKELVRGAVGKLPPKMRRCLSLWLDQELKYREIAVAMQVSTDTIRSQMAQAKQRLRLLLGDHFE